MLYDFKKMLRENFVQDNDDEDMIREIKTSLGIAVGKDMTEQVLAEEFNECGDAADIISEVAVNATKGLTQQGTQFAMATVIAEMLYAHDILLVDAVDKYIEVDEEVKVLIFSTMLLNLLSARIRADEETASGTSQQTH